MGTFIDVSELLSNLGVKTTTVTAGNNKAMGSNTEPMTDEQKRKMFENTEYVEVYSKINEMVQNEILNLVKAKIENTPEGKELLSQQLKIVKQLKSNIINETNKEMEMFKRFKDFSKMNPGITYEDFIKANM